MVFISQTMGFLMLFRTNSGMVMASSHLQWPGKGRRSMYKPNGLRKEVDAALALAVQSPATLDGHATRFVRFTLVGRLPIYSVLNQWERTRSPGIDPSRHIMVASTMSASGFEAAHPGTMSLDDRPHSRILTRLLPLQVHSPIVIRLRSMQLIDFRFEARTLRLKA